MYVAYFLIVLVPGQLWPALLGPYRSHEGCMEVEERVAECELDTQGCELMSVPQDAAAIRLEDVPVCQPSPDALLAERHDRE